MPRGTLRLHTSTVAEMTFVGSLLAEFLTAHPQVRLDLTASDAPVDIVSEGYDAGIQLGEAIDQDMIAVPVTGEPRLAVVGAPSYFARRGVPAHQRLHSVVRPQAPNRRVDPAAAGDESGARVVNHQVRRDLLRTPALRLTLTPIAVGSAGIERAVRTGATFSSATRKGEKLVVVPQIVLVEVSREVVM